MCLSLVPTRRWKIFSEAPLTRLFHPPPAARTQGVREHEKQEDVGISIREVRRVQKSGVPRAAAAYGSDFLRSPSICYRYQRRTRGGEMSEAQTVALGCTPFGFLCSGVVRPVL